MLLFVIIVGYVKFICSEKATHFYEISTIDLFYVVSNGHIYGGDFAKFCGLLRTYELYIPTQYSEMNIYIVLPATDNGILLKLFLVLCFAPIFLYLYDSI